VFRPFVRIFVFLCSLFVGIGSARADLAADIGRILDTDAARRAEIGISIVRIGQVREADRLVYSLNPRLPLIPASNLKLLTTSAAIDLLGPDFKFQTVLAVSGSSVAIVGDGDPTLGDSELLRGTGWSINTVFDNWSARLKSSGLASVDSLLVDDSIFDQEFFHPNWPTDQAHKDYVPQVGGLNLNANCLDVFLDRSPADKVLVRVEPSSPLITLENSAVVGSTHSLWLARVLGGNRIVVRGTIDAANRLPFRVTVHDPPMFAGSVMGESLRRAGLTPGSVSRDRTIRAALLNAKPDADSWRVVARHETPLARVLDHTNKVSANLYAEALLKRIGAHETNRPGSSANGRDALAKHALAVGCGPADFTLDDGSGLSKSNRATASGFVAVLSHQFHGPHRDLYLNSLSVGGVDGTLSRRFRNDLKSRVLGKSGSVSGVSCLSGFLKTRSGEWYAFSILMNRTDRATAQPLQDAIVNSIDQNAD
jgi:serine-type D-Ala-D-Ala carboxypeptidase/endopeptidase (penicillin-binding protein 4)